MTAMEITLIVKYPTGGKIVRGDEKLLAVIEDGQRREPKTSDVDVAYRWLMSQDYEPIDFEWLDNGGGLARRRRQTYKRQADANIDAKDATLAAVSRTYLKVHRRRRWGGR